MAKPIKTLRRAQEWLRGHGKPGAAAILSGLISQFKREAHLAKK